MISVILAGGLGNQLFQYAAARHVAHRLGTGLVLDVRAFSLDIYERSYALAPFRLAQDVILLGDPAPRSLLRRHPTLRAVLWRIRRKVLPRLRHRLVSDRGFRFDPMLLAAAVWRESSSRSATSARSPRRSGLT